MQINVKLIAAAIAVAMIFGAGYHMAANRYKREIAEVCAKNAHTAAVAEAQNREKEKRYAERLSEAVDKLAAATADRDSLRSDLDRVRTDNAALKRALSSNAGATCATERAAIARCSELLERGAELAVRGSGMAGQYAAERDALSGLHE